MPDWPIFDHDTLDSTSDEARRLVESGVPPPFVVRARCQTRGRGRGANTWWSDEGSLLFTVVPDARAMGIEARHEPRLALVAALAVIEAARDLTPALAAGIRWPNDVEAGGRKLAGVLPERVETGTGPRLLIGVGINVTTRLEGAPREVRAMATTLFDQGGIDRPEELLGRFLGRFEEGLRSLVEDERALAGRWQVLDLLRDRPIRVRQADRIINGLARGIAVDGSLLLETEDGIVSIVGGQVLRDP
jgi:BirA family biotin operon repressor/biotin-[acetyl-CoA-carboxylase] ligase